jgi:Cft2 family RNA processing exonuclease
VRGGIHLPQLSLWLDPPHSQTGLERVFVSHAHSDHIARHREVIMTEATARFLRHRIGPRRVEHVLGLGETFQSPKEDWELTLLPAGHTLGSAMALIRAGAESVLYTGDFKLQKGFTAEPCTTHHADVLIMETTFGRPEYVFPPAPDVLRDLVNFCRETLDGGGTPVLFCYSLGKSQEVLAGLAGTDLPIQLHSEPAKLTTIYEKLECKFPAWERFDGATARGKVLIGPPHLDRQKLQRDLGRIRTAVVTGWALDPRTKYRCRVDAAFPLSDHADFPDLIEFVKRVAPKQVFTMHGFAADFARTLRGLGFDARALSQDEQLELRLE